MNTLNLIYLIIAIVYTVASCGAYVFTMRKAWKARTAATTDAAKEKADSDLLATAKGFISAAEVAFDAFDKTLKAQGSSAGAMKKDTVFNKLQAYALQKGYSFDCDEWSKKIDELVAFTKSVNAQK